MTIAENISTVTAAIQTALLRRTVAGAPGPVRLVAVTKNQDIIAMRAAIAAGVTAIGENRIQEALGKRQELGCSTEWHLIGHLQTNKVQLAIQAFELIHSVDSERLALEINRLAGKNSMRQKILLQVNVAGEESKFGVRPEEVMALARSMAGMEHVCLCGLMTIAPFYEQAEEARPVFRRLYELFTALRTANLPNTAVEWLSMGMTHDYEVAIEEGANLVRIGTGIFGTRQY
jgi:PLP dependent protein